MPGRACVQAGTRSITLVDKALGLGREEMAEFGLCTELRRRTEHLLDAVIAPAVSVESAVIIIFVRSATELRTTWQACGTTQVNWQGGDV